MSDWRTILLGTGEQATRRVLFGMGWALLVPALLGAKGCEVGQIGDNNASCAEDADCNEGEFCETDGKKCGGDGSCSPLPELCTLIYAPVCGCDGETYGNECDAHSKGVSVAKNEACEGSGANACGGLTGASCGDGEFCKYSLESSCGAADQTGVCTQLPEACDLVYSPVCGCDDKTYGNECAAHSAGVSVSKNEACEGGGDVVCGGPQGAACDKGQFCDFAESAACGAGNQTGICQNVPELCPAIYAPVCGCDGKTHGSACSANGAGVSVAYDGECKDEPTGAACGSRGLPECGKDEFCSYPEDAECGAADAPGTCEKKPETCNDIYSPVCGCDGKTYGNECEAQGAGVSVAAEGECTTDRTCGGLLGLTCEKGEFCDYPKDALCGRADATGTCKSQPEACPEIYAPVCGCDGMTYSSDCVANGAGVSVESEGECSTTGAACGGIAGLGCEEGEFCNYPVETMCGSADQQGTCEAIPEACTLEFAPVCGCDQKTYGNACAARSAGVSVASEGECESPSVPCGGESPECEEGKFCKYPVDAECRAPDARGTCTTTPEACDAIADPVCGCDDVTYANECEAQVAGVAIRSMDSCEEGAGTD